MSTIKIQIKGIAAELVLGNYMPTDATIMGSWEEFFHYNDLLHESQLLADQISSIEIIQDDIVVFSGRIPLSSFIAQKSFSPFMVERALYLRTECVEKAVYEVEFETEVFDKSKLKFETQDYDHLFKVGTAFLSQITYDGNAVDLVWKSAEPVGNICLLCRFENGFLVPVYDAIRKLENMNL